MKNPFGNMGNILKQAQAMQAQMAKVQEQASAKTVTGTAGGGSVTVTANGAMQLLGIIIDPEDALRLAEASRAVKDGLSFCRQCRNIAEGELCEYGLDPKRDQTRILVVEEPSTTYAIERAGAYRGLYHVLLGALSPLDGVGPSDIRTEELVDRVKLGGIEEVILATSPTIEGEATAIYLTNQLKPLGARVSRIAYGIPVGMDIEYADEVTLLKSIEGRRDL